MSPAGTFFWVTTSSLAVSSCFDPPEFPIIPEIAYENIRFVDRPDPSTDSLVLELSFKDGDGDLGLDPTESVFKHNNKWYYFNDRWYYTLVPAAGCDDN